MQRFILRRATPSLLRPLTAPRAASSFTNRPSPPKLPAGEQAEFERLQREASVSSAFQPVEESSSTTASSSDAAAKKPSEDELHESGALFRGAKPEFDGDTNPRTGEVGGPKNEPLRWGSAGDWSYNGKVTDF
ncbi:hypothetical protein K4F52_000404 [Lecanicillium sp. MT-2017a]|nr:hypothetical protein K4F52_000404 [Lecanicillium sp. MT-2017a]